MQYDTRTALIVTSTIFYNISKPTKKFKNEFLTTYSIEKFFDLSPVRRLIFEQKNSPASVVYYRLSKDKDYLDNVISHQSVKSNRFLKYFKMLVIEKFDQKEIFQKHFIDNDWMFKVALYGNTLDFHLLNRVFGLKGYKISELENNVEFHFGAGIKSNRGDDFAEKLIGLPLIENSNVQEFYTPISESNQNTD